jgi:hypothetical protein
MSTRTSITSSADPNHTVVDLPTDDVNLTTTERAISIAAATLLFGWGAYRRGLIGYGAMGLAGILWARGRSGHSSILAALGRKNLEERFQPEERPTEPGMIRATPA